MIYGGERLLQRLQRQSRAVQGPMYLSLLNSLLGYPEQLDLALTVYNGTGGLH